MVHQISCIPRGKGPFAQSTYHFLVSTISPLSSWNPKYCQTLLFALGGERSGSSGPASAEDAIAIAG